jgi:hypothetical protein
MLPAPSFLPGGNPRRHAYLHVSNKLMELRAADYPARVNTRTCSDKTKRGVKTASNFSPGMSDSTYAAIKTLRFLSTLPTVWYIISEVVVCL